MRLLHGSAYTLLGVMTYVRHCGPFVLALACFGASPALAAEVRPSCPVAIEDEYYFPSEVFDLISPKRDLFIRKWYSKHLRAMSEPSMSCGLSIGIETYRFLWLRTFDHPVSIRVDHSAEGTNLIAVELDGAGGYEPGGVLRNIQNSLSLDQWKSLTGAVALSGFWTQPTSDPNDMGGLDGAEWIVEARRGPTYHLVDRWSPEGGEHRALGLFFLNLVKEWPMSGQLY